MSDIRLQKYLAKCGVASRRKAEELILEGRVTVNDAVVIEMGFKIGEKDVVKVDSKPVYQEDEKVYIILNKPVGYVTTSKDQFSRLTVLDLIKDVPQRIYPVGRLDYDTSGLLILTNDGEFTYKVTHPSHEMQKTYVAEIKGIPTMQELERFRNGLSIEDYITSAAKIKIIKENKMSSVVEVQIHEGRNRQVRKMCEEIGHKVTELKRTAIGGLKLGDLPAGKWRYLKDFEINLIMNQGNILRSKNLMQNT